MSQFEWLKRIAQTASSDMNQISLDFLVATATGKCHVGHKGCSNSKSQMLQALEMLLLFLSCAMVVLSIAAKVLSKLFLA